MELLEREEPAFRLFTDVFSRFVIRGAVGQTNPAFEDTENGNQGRRLNEKHVSFNLKEKDPEVIMIQIVFFGYFERSFQFLTESFQLHDKLSILSSIFFCYSFMHYYFKD